MPGSGVGADVSHWHPDTEDRRGRRRSSDDRPQPPRDCGQAGSRSPGRPQGRPLKPRGRQLQAGKPLTTSWRSIRPKAGCYRAAQTVRGRWPHGCSAAEGGRRRLPLSRVRPRTGRQAGLAWAARHGGTPTRHDGSSGWPNRRWRPANEWPRSHRTEDPDERMLGVWLHIQRISYPAEKMDPAKENQTVMSSMGGGTDGRGEARRVGGAQE